MSHPPAGAALPQSSRADERAWKTFPNSPVEYQVLRKHAGEDGGITLLLRFPPDSDYPAHRHPGGEEYFVMEGTLIDGGKEHPAGSYVYHPEDSVHRPRSRTGCTVFVHLPSAIADV